MLDFKSSVKLKIRGGALIVPFMVSFAISEHKSKSYYGTLVVLKFTSLKNLSFVFFGIKHPNLFILMID